MNTPPPVALITGSSRGIGRAIATEFATRGYNLVINCLHSLDQAVSLKSSLETKYHVQALVVPADISKEADVEFLVQQALATFGKIDVLVNNAGIAIDKDFSDHTVKDWELTLATNLIGPFLTSRAVGRLMREQGNGKIINISSTNGINSFFPTSAAYDASKAALINLTHNLAIEFAPSVNVNAVAPGWVNTEMNQDLPADLITEETAKIYKGRFAEPSEIAKVVAFLASPDADFINDEVVKVDGGYNN